MGTTIRASRAAPRKPLAPAPRAPKSVLARHAAELTALALAFAGLALLIALASYDPHDPSLNTASSRETHNLVGPLGAILSDLLLQSFGAPAALPGITMLVWAWRLGSRRGMGSVAVRLASLLGAIPVASAVLASLASPAAIGWPTLAGPGGAAGPLIARTALRISADLAGPAGEAFAWLAGVGLSIALIAMALGLTVAEWRSAGRLAHRAAHVTARGGRTGWRWLGFGAPVNWSLPAVPSVLPRRRVEPEGPAAEMRPEYAPVPVPDSIAPPLVTGSKRPASPPPRPPDRTPPKDDRQETLPLDGAGWRCPSLSLLMPPPQPTQTGPTDEALEGNARLLIKVLADYGVKGKIVDFRPGPVVTLYELEPEPGIRSARVVGLADDVARSLSVTAVRIATVPGRNVIGIEVPNARRDTVYLSEILSSDEVRKNTGRLPIALGKNIGGQAVVADLSRMPHLMIAGTTGSGKSVGVNAMILSLLYRLSPDQCRLILIDPKMLELSIYDGIPHLMAPVVTEPAKAVTALKWVVREMERRYRAMSQLGVRNIGGYNERVEDARRKGEIVTRRVQTGFDSETSRPTFEDQPLALEPLPFIVVVVDEMADLMMVAGKEIEAAVQRLAQMARAAGIHVIMATQRPSVDVITGTIKANFPTRISFQVISKFDSRTILGEQGAEQLLGMGDMLYMQGGGRITRVHGPFVSDEEVERVVAWLREQGEPVYLDEVTEPVDKDDEAASGGMSPAGGGETGLFDQAVDLVAREGKATTSFIQRHLNIGYNRAAKLIEQMEREGMVGPANHVGKREILLRRTNRDED